MKSLHMLAGARACRVSPLRGEWIEIISDRAALLLPFVSPLRGEWIEIMWPARTAARQIVSPLRGEWIEI